MKNNKLSLGKLLLNPWFIIPVVFLLGRSLAIIGHYLLKTPFGSKITENVGIFFPFALAAELSIILGAIVCFRVLGHFLSSSCQVGQRKWLISGLIISLGVFSVLSQIDLELKRWMGIRLNFTWLEKSFLLTTHDQDLTGKILGSDLFGVAWASVCCLGPIFLSFFLWKKYSFQKELSQRATSVLVFTWASLAFLPLWANPSDSVWRQVRPVPYQFVEEVYQSYFQRPQVSEEGLRLLREHVQQSQVRTSYPLWQVYPQEKESIAEFRKKSLSEKPDIFIFVVESFRSWVVDFRDSRVEKIAPNLFQLWQERGRVYPRFHSNGYPSAEGIMSLHLGLWSHPHRIILHENVAMHSRSFSEILQLMGYHRTFLLGAEPTFDNLPPWLKKWYDHWEYDPLINNDELLARRFIELYEKMPTDQPKLMTLATVSTHKPYTLPPSEGEHPEDLQEAYIRAIRYLDRSLGTIIDHLRKSPRWKQTIIICTGDHSQPTEEYFQYREEIGLPNIGHTWIPLLLAAPYFSGEELDLRSSSHVDIPPTILDILKIKASHHFLGHSLLSAEENSSAYSIFFRGIGISQENFRYQIRLDDPRFAHKYQYDFSSEKGEGLPSRKKLKKLAWTEEEKEKMKTTRTMFESYSYILDNDLIRPREK